MKNIKKMKKGLSILVLLLCSINVLGQGGTGIIYEVSQSTIDCENNKVCYTIAVKATDDVNHDGSPMYYNSATFRYFIDADIFEKPENKDYTPLLFDGKYPIYTITQSKVEEPILGNELGFRSERTYWPKAVIKTTSPGIFPRVRVTTTPIEIMKICLTPKDSLNTVTSEENLCYPFVFDYNPRISESGITQGSEGIVTSFTKEANSSKSGGDFQAGIRGANQYLWSYDSGWDGDSNSDQAIGHTATEGCMQNTCLCYASPTKKGTALETFAGISTLDRNVDGSWVDNSKGGFLKLESKTLGFVPTRMTTTERNDLTAEEGMVIWNTTTNCLEYYNGTEWVCSKFKCKKENNQ